MSKKNLFIFFFALAIISAMVSGWYLGSASAVDYFFSNSHGDLTISTDTMISDCENSAYSYSPDNTLFFKSSCKIFYTNSDTYGEIYQYYDYVHMFYLNDDAQISVSENNGVYTFTSDTRFRYQNYGYAWRESLNGQYYFADNPGYRSDWHNNDWCFSIIYDSNNNTITCDNSDMFPAVHYFGDTYDLQSLSASWDISDNHYNSDGLNVSVVFRPEFSGEVNRATVLSNGNIDYLDNFNFDIINNSDTAVQWLMAIVEKGSSISFDLSSTSVNDNTVHSRGADRVIYDDNIKYVYISQEDVYLNSNVPSFVSACTANSSMHYIPASGYSGYIFVKWDMVDLQDNHEYDVVVYAVANTSDRAVFYDNGDSHLAYINTSGGVVWSDIEEVYRSSFIMKNPAVYNPNSSYHGAIANGSSSDYDALTNKLYSYTDVQTGKVIYGDYQYNGTVVHDGSVSQIPSSSYVSYSGFISKISNVFKFFSAVLGFFPSDIIYVYNLGLWSLIIVLIIRRLH